MRSLLGLALLILVGAAPFSAQHGEAQDRGSRGRWSVEAEIYPAHNFHPAPRVGFGIFRSNPPPSFHDEIESPIFVPQLLQGVRF